MEVVAAKCNDDFRLQSTQPQESEHGFRRRIPLLCVRSMSYTNAAYWCTTLMANAKTAKVQQHEKYDVNSNIYMDHNNIIAVSIGAAAGTGPDEHLAVAYTWPRPSCMRASVPK
eukprot:4793038-Pleurochrysis_carterae.AAC.11